MQARLGERRVTFSRFLLVVALWLIPANVRARNDTAAVLANPPAAHPHRIIVKYRSTVNVCAHCLLERGVPFASVTGTPSLDRLNRRFKVKTAQTVFTDHSGSVARAAAYRATLDDIRSRFPARAARAARSAVAPDLSNTFVLDIGSGDVAAAAAAFTADPDVEYAEPDYEVHVSLTPNDPFFSSSGSWGQSFADL